MEEKKAVKDCPFCGEEILEKAIKCKHCGSDLTKPVQATQVVSEVDQKVKNANITAIVGAVLLIIGLFLPWMSAGIVSVTGFEKVQDAVIFLVLGAAIGVLGLLGISTKKNYGLLIVLCSLGSLLFLAFIYFQMLEVSGGSGAFSPQIASGFYVSGVGALIGLIGGAMLAQKPKDEKHMVCTKCKEIVIPQNTKCPQCGSSGNLIVHPRSDTGKKIVAELVSKNPEKYKKMAGVK
jgi:predicted RNA-binding Zn-ribbon protein involved in translation (DUF1610 family)